MSSATSWRGVLRSLGISPNQAHAARILQRRCIEESIDHAHLLTRDAPSSGAAPAAAATPRARGAWPPAAADLGSLHRAGSMIVAATLTLCGTQVSWPLEPAAYDLVIHHGDALRRVQVKTTTQRRGATWVCSLTRSRYDASDPARHRRHVYDLDVIDDMAIVDGDLVVYVIPYPVVAGRSAIHLRPYTAYAVGQFGAPWPPIAG